MQENVIVSHRGARYEIGRGPGFYGIWPAGASRFPPVEWWPETAEGWQEAWSRFSEIESRRVIQPAGQSSGPGQPPGPDLAAGQARPPDTAHRTAGLAAWFSGAPGRAGRPAIVASALLAIGVAVGIAGLFPGYFGRASLAQQAADVVPHAIYLAVWAAGAVLIALGGTRQRTGALLAAGTSFVTFGLFVADAGTAISAGVPVAAGLVLTLIGWAACAAGSVLAVRQRGAGSPGRPATAETALTLGLAAAAALGTAIAFAPPWDRFTLRTAAGTSQTLTAGNVFANPGLVIAGDVTVMVALVAVVIAAAAWRPMRQGAVLLVGAIVPMAAQAISAAIQISQPASPLQFGIPSAQAAGAGLTISSSLTLAFWIYCGFVGALILTCALMSSASAAPPPPPAPVPARPGPLDATFTGPPSAPSAPTAQTVG